MWIFCNPNPCHVLVGDCAIRACTIQLDSNWHKVHRDLCDLSDVECNMPSANVVWGQYLESKGLVCRVPSFPVAVRQFCRGHPRGCYTIGTGSHGRSFWPLFNSKREEEIQNGINKDVNVGFLP